MLRITIDTREQQPWSFPPEVATTARGTLSAGDYCITGDDQFVIERKSLDDLVGTLSTGWERFLRELDRMEVMGSYPMIVIVEGTWMQILGHKYNHPRVSPRFVQSRLADLTFRGVHILFADNAHAAAGMAWVLFYHRMKIIAGELYDAGNSDSQGQEAPA